MSRRQPAKQLSAMYSLVLSLVLCLCAASLSSAASSVLRACSARELLKIVIATSWLTAVRSVLDELPTQRPCADRRSALAQGARRPLLERGYFQTLNPKTLNPKTLNPKP